MLNDGLGRVLSTKYKEDKDRAKRRMEKNMKTTWKIAIIVTFLVAMQLILIGGPEQARANTYTYNNNGTATWSGGSPVFGRCPSAILVTTPITFLVVHLLRITVLTRAAYQILRKL